MKRKQAPEDAPDQAHHPAAGSPTPRRSQRARRPSRTDATPQTPKRRKLDVSQDGSVPATPAIRDDAPSTPGTVVTPTTTPTTTRTPRMRTGNRVLFADARGKTKAAQSPSVVRNADRSAKRKSMRTLMDPTEDDVWDRGDKLAQEIWEGEGERKDEEDVIDGGAAEEIAGETLPIDEGTPVATEMTPKRKGRPKGTRNRRSPTPEGDIPAHERYFFQNRPGPVQTSDNTLRGITLLTHEEYFEQMEKYADPHTSGKDFLFDLHSRSFAQWDFELLENFSVCLYGYGSKRKLVHRFAEWLYERHEDPADQPSIVVVNGYVSGTTVRSIFATVVEAIFAAEDMPPKLGTQPAEVLELIQSSLEREPPQRPIIVLINSIDAPALRRPAYQAALARLASLPYINLLATADTPNFTLLWDISLRDQFNFVFHDCTTFEPFSTEEINVVDEVNTLLGRKVRRIGGRDGINFVLKSLPDNTRKLYRLLLTEILTVMAEQEGLSEEEGNGKADTGAGAEENAFVSWRTMYHKATEEFISSSELMFRTQLKEFYDHQMIISKTDVGGMELLGVPLLREEMESVLEELMME